MIGSLNLAGGGSSKINGIIEEYKVASGGNIDAGDFVRFVEDRYSEEILLASGSYGITDVNTTLLDENRVLITYIHKLSSSTQNLYGIVCTIYNNSVSISIPTQIISKPNNVFSVILLKNKNVLILYNKTTTQLYGNVCKIVENEITVGIETILQNTTNSLNSSQAVEYEDNKICVICGESNKAMYNIMCSINDTIITTGNRLKIDDSLYTYATGTISLILLNNLLFICLAYQKVLVIQCNISNDELIVETTTTIDNTSAAISSLSVKKIDGNKILFIYERHTSATNNFLYGIVCKIVENEITVGARTDLSLKTSFQNYLSITVLDKHTIILINSGRYGMEATPYYLYYTVCNITDMNIKILNQKLMDTSSDYSIGAIKSELLDKYNIFITTLDDDNKKLYGLNWNINTITNTQILYNICGIAKTSGAENAIVKVMVPN